MREKIQKHFKIIFPLIHVLAITGLGFLLYFTYNEALALIKEQFNNQQMLVAKQTAMGIEGNINLLMRELERLAYNPAIKTFRIRDGQEIMEETFAYVKGFNVNDLVLLDAKGIIKFTLGTLQSPGADLSQQQYFKHVSTLKDNTPIIEFITFKGLDVGKKGIIIAMPIFQRKEEFGGAIIFNVQVEELIKGFIPSGSSESKSCVIDSEGNVLCNPRNFEYNFGGNAQGADPEFRIFLEDVKYGEPSSTEYLSSEGVKTIAVSYPISISNQIWSMVIVTPEEILSRLLTSFTVKYIIATLITILIVTIASVFIIYLINRMNIELDSMVKIRTKELSLSEEKIRSMVENINELIWEIDVDGKYVYVSPIAKKILGYTPEELIGKPIFDLMHEEDAQKFKTTLQGIGTKKEPFNNLERINIHKNGKHVILETNGAPILDDQGNLIGFRGVDRNITERKQAEKELEKYADELEAARRNLEIKVEERTRELQKVHETLVRKEKFAALGELSSSVSHELRNPLGVIKNAIYFFNMKIDSFQDKTIRENIKIITREIDNANKIITDLLDFTRSKPPVSLDIDLNQLAREMLEKSLIPNNIEVIKDFNANMTNVSADPTQVAQIFLNLIENAVQAMGDGGTLQVTTKATDHATEIVFTDNGCGISKSNLEHIFEPLFTTKVKGIGLGLAISQNMAKANGAIITVESTEGKGTSMTVSFRRDG